VTALHAGMQHALEKMKEAVRNGGRYERDPVENALPFVTLGVVAVGLVLFTVYRLSSG
jgi:hypothetical protein